MWTVLHVVKNFELICILLHEVLYENLNSAVFQKK